MNWSSMSKCLQCLLLVSALAVALTIHYSAVPSHAADMDTAARVLAKLDDAWSAAAATKDAEKVASYYAVNAVAYPPGEPLAVGRDAAKKVWAAYFADPTFKISWKTLHAVMARSGDLGFTAGTYEASYTVDGKSITEKGKYLCNWAKQKDGSWKAIHDMWNTDKK